MRAFLRLNQKACGAFNRLLPKHVITDGNLHFRDRLVPTVLAPGQKLYDIGGGSQPCIDADAKARYGIELVGLDISAEELEAAPPALYDEKIVADLTRYRGRGDADVIVCQSVLEHVEDNERSVRALSEILKPDGTILVFVPCRNALFARLNLSIPQGLKKRLLAYMYPEDKDHIGFPVRYDKCTPRQLTDLFRKHGIEVTETRLFWKSGYFNSFVPAYFFWRFWQVILFIFIRYEAAETFILTGRKTP